MELGEKLRQARLRLGLSQRQVCGDQITRNMLSRIENGQAKPSMKTLQYLSSVLQMPVGYFLGEATACMNQPVMDEAKEAYVQKKYTKALRLLGDYNGPDDLYDWEMGLLGYLCCLEIADAAIREGRLPVAGKLLTQAEQFSSPYIVEPLTRRREELLQALGKGKGMPSNLDEALLVRAEDALECRDYQRALRFLEAVEQQDRRYHTLRGTVELRLGNYTQAEQHLLLGQEQQALPLLEECFRAQGDFEKAYYYAKMQK